MTVPLETAISLANLKRGQEEWFNVQDPVRFALETIVGHLQEQSRAISKLEQSTTDKTGARPASAQGLDTLRSQVYDSQAELTRRLSALESRQAPEGVTHGHLTSVLRQLEEHFGREVETASKATADAAADGLRELEARLRTAMEGAARETERGVGRQLEELAGRVDGVGAETLALRRQLEGLGGRLALPESLERRLRDAAEGGAAEVRRRVEELAARLDTTAAGMQRSLADVQASANDSQDKLANSMAALREKVERVSAASVEVERRLAAGLQDLQAEWQATAASLKAEAAAVAEAKCGDTERRLGAALGSKIDTNAHAAQREGAELRRRIADLERGKVDKASMEKFTTEVLDAFDSTNAANMEELATKWDAQLAAVRTDIATQVSSRASNRDMQAAAERVDEVIEGLNLLRHQVEGLEREAHTRETFCTKDDARRVASEMMRQQELQREQGATLSAVSKAASTAAAALAAAEAEAEKRRQLAEKLAALTEAVFGRQPLSAGSPAGHSLSDLFSSSSRSKYVTPGKSSPGDGLVRRFTAMESLLDKLSSELRGKLSALDMEALQAQVADHSGSLEDLTTETYRRADELAAAIQSLHKVLASNFADRPTLASVQAMIKDMAKQLAEEEERRLGPLLDHTHTVEHAERVLVQEDGTRVTLESGPLEGVKVADDGRVSGAVWQKLSRLEARYESVLRAQQELAGRLSPVRFRGSPQSPGPGEAVDAPSTAGLRQRLDALERAHESAVYEIKNVQRKVDAAQPSRAAKSSPDTEDMRKREEERWEVLMDRLGYILDGKAGKEDVERLAGDLERKIASELEGKGLAGSMEGISLHGTTESRLKAIISGKADKEEVDGMFQSLRRALDAKPSYSEMQSALKAKLDIQTYLDSGSKARRPAESEASPSPTPPSAPPGAFRPRSISPHQARSFSPPPAARRLGVSPDYGYGASTRSVLEEQARTMFSSRMSDASFS